ncbi:MAG: hypothetical protein AAF711_00025 [Planctomycetota bacterium]
MDIFVEVSPAMLPEIFDIYPDGRSSGYGFRSELDHADLRNEKLVECLKRSGFRRRKKQERFLPREHFTEAHIRHYDRADYASAVYLEFDPDFFDENIQFSERDAEARLRLHRKSLRENKSTDFARAGIKAILVPQRVKVVLEQADLHNLLFLPTIPVRGTGLAEECQTPVTWEQVGCDPWWELSSDLTLPPVSPGMDLRDRDGNRIPPGNSSNGCIPREGLFNKAELHYLRNDIKAIEPFDVALTFETFGMPGPYPRPSVVVSQRFYQVCIDHGLSGTWVPVRLDDQATPPPSDHEDDTLVESTSDDTPAAPVIDSTKSLSLTQRFKGWLGLTRSTSESERFRSP